MTLDHFRQVAQEKTAHIQMTPALRARILAGLAKSQKRRPHRAAWAAAAACLALMFLSAAAMMTQGFGAFAGEPDALSAGGNTPGLSMNPPNSGVQLTIPVAATHVGGIVPVQDESGLWGYQDRDGKWLCEPKFASAEPIDAEALCGRVVTVEGVEEMIILQVSD